MIVDASAIAKKIVQLCETGANTMFGDMRLFYLAAVRWKLLLWSWAGHCLSLSLESLVSSTRVATTLFKSIHVMMFCRVPAFSNMLAQRL